ncbi:type II toxin-antitoxin system prevent-host-death family antitoxin [Actinomadura sp. 9N215]|uniref:type II toxin-antitoxin system prevent-host-death family antitoxin n=1 Tax=Actinomadura sp. 9N215 TaxID=3375150 RepID=UPI0037B07C19
MERLGVDRARQLLPALVDSAAGGTSTVLTDRGRPVAAITGARAVTDSADAESLGIRAARPRFFELVDLAHTTNKVTVITRRGTPLAAIVPVALIDDE